MYVMAIGNEQLSSLYQFTIDTTKNYLGDVTFYDQINCQGNELKITPTLGFTKERFTDYSHPDGNWKGRVLSFRINGNYIVGLMTPMQKKCQAHWNFDVTNCVRSIKGTTIYNPADPNERPHTFWIFPSE